VNSFNICFGVCDQTYSSKKSLHFMWDYSGWVSNSIYSLFDSVSGVSSLYLENVVFTLKLYNPLSKSL